MIQSFETISLTRHDSISPEEVNYVIAQKPAGDDYFSYFLRVLNQSHILEILEPQRIRYNREFKEYLIDKYGKTFKTINLLDKIFTGDINKPHRCLFSADNYFIAIDLIKNMYCIYYRDLMVIDIDYDQTIKNIDDVINLCKSKTYRDSYIIYSTSNGAHIFVVNREFEHNSVETIEYMLNFGCDFNYVLITYMVGWCIRLNKKHKDDQMYKYVCSINETNGKRKALVDIHIEASNKFKNNLVC